jgi:acetoacetyl-CoA synthetase
MAVCIAIAGATKQPVKFGRSFEMTDTPLWSPDQSKLEDSPWMAFAGFAGERSGLSLTDPLALQDWSVTDREGFWSALWDFCGVRGDKGDRIVENGDAMPGARFFPDARLNFAENLLTRTGDPNRRSCSAPRTRSPGR